jgi:uncharacterized protein with GYD domain
MPKGVILVDYTDQGRRSIKDSPNRAEAANAEAAKLGLKVKDIFFTPGGPWNLMKASINCVLE